MKIGFTLQRKRPTDNCVGVRYSGGIRTLTINSSGVNDPNNAYLVRRGLESRKIDL